MNMVKDKLKKYKTFTIEQLEDYIINYWSINKTVDDELKICLFARRRKINDIFEWTPENINELLNLNQKLINCFEKLKNEAISIAKTFQKRIEEKDDFLHDFEIEAKITPFVYMLDGSGMFYEAENGIERILMDSLDEYSVLYHHFKLNETTDSEINMIYLNIEQNWSNDSIFGGKFDGQFISQAIHDLYDHTCWSIPDILKINHLWTELRVVHQNFEYI
jgi:hypothetical protein